MKPVYFSKVEYRETIGHGNTHSIILLNIPEKELSYQVFEWKNQMPAIQGIKTEEWYGKEITFDIRRPAKIIKNGKTMFEGKMVEDDFYQDEVVFSYAVNLSEKQMEKILPLCNALDFEPYRNRKMVMGEEGYIGYRDEVNLYFRAVTDSYIPLLELPMDYYYDEEHIWPSEKLYRYLVRAYLSENNDKKLRGWGPSYGGCSLFM